MYDPNHRSIRLLRSSGIAASGPGDLAGLRAALAAGQRAAASAAGAAGASPESLREPSRMFFTPLLAFAAAYASASSTVVLALPTIRSAAWLPASKGDAVHIELT